MAVTFSCCSAEAYSFLNDIRVFSILKEITKTTFPQNPIIIDQNSVF
tara:strand:+ start:1514 stop:1654 length:141 start_codon:yes stop_codon:yes gene_type:complete